MPKISEIIEAVNAEIAGKKDAWYSAWHVRELLQKHFSGTLISDRDGVYFYVSRGDDRQPEVVNAESTLVLIKATRQKIEVKSRWEGPITRMSVCQLALVGPNGDKTPEEITAIYREQAAVLQKEQQDAEKQDYLAVTAFLEKTGTTVEELGAVFGIYDKRKYTWSNLEEKYS